MLIGYVRVSSKEQNEARQVALMNELGVSMLFTDKLSGRNTERPELKKMLGYIRKGDTVIVESISRFARNTKDFLNLIEILTSKEVEFKSHKEKIDTTTLTGKFMLTIFAAVSELEREYILQRQREGIELAKAAGKYTGRKRIERDDFKEVYDRWLRKEITAVQAMKRLNLSKTTFYRRIAELRNSENDRQSMMMQEQEKR